MYAILRAGGKQLKVTPGDVVRIETPSDKVSKGETLTLSDVLMVGAYGWAFVKPLRKLYYNMTITFVSVIVALLVLWVLLAVIGYAGLMRERISQGKDVAGYADDTIVPEFLRILEEYVDKTYGAGAAATLG